MKKAKVLLLFVVAVIISGPSWAKSDIKFLETSLVFEGKKRTGKLTIYNQGDVAGKASIVLRKLIVDEKGERSFEDMDFEYNRYPYNVDVTKFLRISPRKIILEPKKRQAFRIFFRKPQDFPDGEYRVFAFLESEDLEQEEAEGLELSGDNLGMSVEVSVNYGIPIYFYQGSIIRKIVDLDNIELLELSEENVSEHRSHELRLRVTRDGNAVIPAKVHFYGINAKGKEEEIGSYAASIFPDHKVSEVTGYLNTTSSQLNKYKRYKIEVKGVSGDKTVYISKEVELNVQQES